MDSTDVARLLFFTDVRICSSLSVCFVVSVPVDLLIVDLLIVDLLIVHLLIVDLLIVHLRIVHLLIARTP